jgi:hypothetical protein
MYCTNCGIKIAERSNFCPECGTALIVQPETQPQLPAIDSESEQQVSGKQTNSFSIVAFVLGILGIFIGPLSIGAIIFGALGISQTGKNPDIQGRGLAVAGLILGIVVVFGWILGIILLMLAWGPIF